jgi:lipoprotein NlpI
MTAIAEFLLDKSDEAAFLAASKRGYNDVAIRGQTAEAYFFVGLKRRLAGDGQKAADYFSQCVAAHQTAYLEYILANAELKTR